MGRIERSTIRDVSAFQDSGSHFDGYLPDEVTGGCDVDLVVERKGQTLFVEWKELPVHGTITLPWGQLRTLSTLAGHLDINVLVVGKLHGTPAGAANVTVVHLDGYCPPPRGGRVTLEGEIYGAQEFRNLISSWWEFANNQPSGLVIPDHTNAWSPSIS